MKSLAELEAIRQRTLEKVAMRKEGDDTVRVVVGMATCGIAAGARPVMLKFLEEIQKRNLQNVTVSQTGCIGMCRRTAGRIRAQRVRAGAGNAHRPRQMPCGLPSAEKAPHAGVSAHHPAPARAYTLF